MCSLSTSNSFQLNAELSIQITSFEMLLNSIAFERRNCAQPTETIYCVLYILYIFIQSIETRLKLLRHCNAVYTFSSIAHQLYSYWLARNFQINFEYLNAHLHSIGIQIVPIRHMLSVEAGVANIYIIQYTYIHLSAHENTNKYQPTFWRTMHVKGMKTSNGSKVFTDRREKKLGKCNIQTPIIGIRSKKRHVFFSPFSVHTQTLNLFFCRCKIILMLRAFEFSETFILLLLLLLDWVGERMRD